MVEGLASPGYPTLGGWGQPLHMNNSSPSPCSRGCEAAPGNAADEFICHWWACVQADGIPQSRVPADSGTHRHTRKPCFLEETGGSLSSCKRRQCNFCLYHLGANALFCSGRKKGIFHLAVSLATPAWQRVNRFGEHPSPGNHIVSFLMPSSTVSFLPCCVPELGVGERRGDKWRPRVECFRSVKVEATDQVWV